LRRRISLRPGEVYNNAKLENSRTAINRTGVFKHLTEKDFAIYPVKEGLLRIVFWLQPRKLKFDV